MKLRSILIITIIFIASYSVNAAVPQLMNYQAVLTDTSGVPVNGDVSIQFRIYDAEVGGTQLWTETQLVSVVDGLLNVLLGDVTPIPYSVFDGSDRWISLQVAGDPEMEPRKRLVSVGNAYKSYDSDMLEGHSSSDFSMATHDHDSRYYQQSQLNTNDGNVNQTSDPVSWSKLKDVPAGFADGTDDGGGGLALPYVESTSALEAFKIENSSSDNYAKAIYGQISSTTPGGFSVAVRGENKGADDLGIGVWGSQSGSGYGVYGTSNGGYAVYGSAITGTGVIGQHGSTAGTDPGVHGITRSTTSFATAVYGVVNSTSPGGFSAGVKGENKGENSNGIGVHGEHAGSGWGVYGRSPSGRGVYGSSSSGVGVYAVSSTGAGVYATSNTNVALYGYRTATNGTNPGVYGRTNSEDANAMGVFGLVNSTSPGGFSAGVRAENNGTGPLGVGLYAAHEGTGWAVYGRVPSNSSGYAGYFSGRVQVTGTLSKGGGSFLIDHPLDPENKYLAHSFVESPDMKNVYDGVLTLDGNGEGWVQLPDWFEALNEEFRYQLTAIGAPAPNIYIAEEISGNRFKIAGGKANMKVSWQVTGIRHDPFAEEYRIKVEQEKENEARGYYLYPELYGSTSNMSIDRAKQPGFKASVEPEMQEPEQQGQ
ncbi:hypothetical protein GF337_16405 [candidate division KSB1 bacterium]|nr:hypothetical protein [candidate division KSB1 bacterium]